MTLREAARNVLTESREGIAWIAIWKHGRAWSTKAFYPIFDPRTDRLTVEDEDDRGLLKTICMVDPFAVIVNPYYCNMGPTNEDMTVASLADGIRYQYQDCGGDLIRNLF